MHTTLCLRRNAPGCSLTRVLLVGAVALLATACDDPKLNADGPQVTVGPLTPPPEPCSSTDADGNALDQPILFSSERTGPFGGGPAGLLELYAMRADGSELRPIHLGEHVHNAAWSPDGCSIAFQHDVVIIQWDISVIGRDGTGLVNLTGYENPDGDDSSATWSRDGQSIAYARVEGEDVKIWVMSNSGGQQRALLPDVPGIQDDPNWSWAKPNLLVYSGAPSGIAEEAEIFLVDLSLDPPVPVNLTQGRLFPAVEPKFSPDGTRVAFWSVSLEDPTDDPEVYVIDIEGGALQQITDNDQSDESPTWSPDGSRLLVSRGGPESALYDLWLVSVDGSGETNMTESNSGGGDGMPAWYAPPMPTDP